MQMQNFQHFKFAVDSAIHTAELCHMYGTVIYILIQMICGFGFFFFCFFLFGWFFMHLST